MTEKHSYEIIVLDLDGTLTNRDKVITPKTKQRLMELQERGKKIVLASGRPTPGAVPCRRRQIRRLYAWPRRNRWGF